MLTLFGDSMHSPASKSGRNRAPSLKGLLAMMAGFFVVFIILAELASATTNDQPATSPVAKTDSVPAAVPEPSAAPAQPVAQTIATAAPRSLTYGANEIIKMYQGGVKADVLLTFIETSNLSYQLSSKEILYLSQIGVPSEIVNAMIRRDHEMDLARVSTPQPTSDSSSTAFEAQPPTPVVYQQPVVVVNQPRVKYIPRVCSVPFCSARVCSYVSQPIANPNVTVIGQRAGSALFNSCYPFTCSPARAYFDAEFGYPSSSCFYGFGYRNRFAFDGIGYGLGYGHHRWGRF